MCYVTVNILVSYYLLCVWFQVSVFLSADLHPSSSGGCRCDQPVSHVISDVTLLHHHHTRVLSVHYMINLIFFSNHIKQRWCSAQPGMV